MNNKHILIIEDEVEIRELLEILLKRQGFKLSSFSSVEDFKAHREKIEQTKIDLVLLDWMLPGQSGYEFLKAVRKQDEWRALPIILLTAKAEPEEIISGLEAGADDYLVKPFDSNVLVARVKALLRRISTELQANLMANSQEDKSTINFGPLDINLKSHEAFIKNEKILLTPTEFKILVILAKQVGRVFTREQLVKSIQGDGINVIGRTIDTHVFSLRKKLGELSEWIETARGVGYRFRDGVEI